MQAWQVHENGEPSEVMRLHEVERPTPGDGQVLLKVRAANINFPDVLTCRGQYQVRPPLPFHPAVVTTPFATAITGAPMGAR